MQSKSTRRLMAITVTIAFILNTQAFANPEFPNYFMEMIKDGDTTHAQAKIEAALASIMRRLQVPYVADDGAIQTQGFFAKIDAKAKEKDPGAKVYIAGGVVRSLLGYIYKKVYHAKQKDPGLSTEAVLDRIIAGKDKKAPEKDKEIMTLSALGVGSDLDVLIESSPEKRNVASELKHELTDLINSAETKAGLREMTSKIKHAVVPVGDVKDYDEQITRTTSQGGSTLDWLAFPITGTSTKSDAPLMKSPPEHPEIFKNLILGRYDYLPPADVTRIEDTDKQTIRGLRPLLEMPYLDLSEKGKTQMAAELNTLISKVRSGGALSPRALEQFEKMIRNARFEGAHNRFYSFDPHPAPGDDREIEKLVHQLSQAVPRREKNLPLIPEFILNRNPNTRGGKDACGLLAAGMLMLPKDFIEKYTDQGKLYHGTPALDNILWMIRNGLIVSSSN